MRKEVVQCGSRFLSRDGKSHTLTVGDGTTCTRMWSCLKDEGGWYKLLQ